MLNQLPPRPDVIADRLASLEDPALAHRLIADNPALFADETPPRTQREILAWATRRFGAALLAVTAAGSIVAGYLLGGFAFTNDAPRTVPVPAAAAPQRTAVRHHAAAHRAPPPRHAVDPQIAALRAALAAKEREVARLRAAAAAAPAAIPAPAPVHHPHRAHVAAAPAVMPVHRAAPKPHEATATAAAPHAQPKSDPATATDPAATTQQRVPVPVDAPAPAPAGDDGVKAPPPSHDGGWSEHPPVLGGYGGNGPIFGGTPRDSCTPRGGRTGMVINAILNATAGGGVHIGGFH